MSKINKEWHLAHKMPMSPTSQERYKWHVDHAANCQCRVLTPEQFEKLKNEAEKR